MQTYQAHTFGMTLDSHTGGPPHAFTHLSAVVLRSHWSANSPCYISNFLLFLYKKVAQNCCHRMRFLDSQCLKSTLAAGLCCPGRWSPSEVAYSAAQISSWIRGCRFSTEKGKGKNWYVKELGREKGRGKKREKKSRRDGKAERLKGRWKRESHAWQFCHLERSVY